MPAQRGREVSGSSLRRRAAPKTAARVLVVTGLCVSAEVRRLPIRSRHPDLGRFAPADAPPGRGGLFPEPPARRPPGGEDAVKALVIIPTYNERENIVQLVRRIAELHPTIDILIVDDSSPDGTAALVKEAQKEFPQLQLIVRGKKNGRG